MAKSNRCTINHGSVYARNPEQASRDLAALTGGTAGPFHPCDGAWVCFLSGGADDWEGPLIEFYPRSITLSSERGQLQFRHTKSVPRGAGTHFNLTVPKTRAKLEAACAELRLTCSWRDWQGLLDVWLEDDLLFECVPG